VPRRSAGTLEHLLAEQAYLVGALGVEALPDGVEVEVHRVGAGRGELAAMMASDPGCRNVPAVISVPSRILLVWTARPASVVQESVGR